MVPDFDSSMGGALQFLWVRVFMDIWSLDKDYCAHASVVSHDGISNISRRATLPKTNIAPLCPPLKIGHSKIETRFSNLPFFRTYVCFWEGNELCYDVLVHLRLLAFCSSQPVVELWAFYLLVARKHRP